MRALLFLIALATAADAQPRGALVSLAVEPVGERGTWTEARVAVGAVAGPISGVVEAGRVERYDQPAAFIGADLYPAVADGAYANLRARWAPASDVTARLDVGAEGYVLLGGGWEGSLGGRRLDFADRAVHLVTAGAGRYAGAWYARATVTAVPESDRVPLSARVLARRYLGDAGAFGAFWEVSVGRGEEAIVAEAGETAIRDSWAVSGRIQRPLAGPLGISGGVGYTEDGELSRAAFEVGLFVRR